MHMWVAETNIEMEQHMGGFYIMISFQNYTITYFFVELGGQVIWVAIVNMKLASSQVTTHWKLGCFRIKQNSNSFIQWTV